MFIVTEYAALRGLRLILKLGFFLYQILYQKWLDNIEKILEKCKLGFEYY